MRTATRPERVLTVDEVGDRLAINRRTVYRLIQNGDLRVVNVAAKGTRIRVREDDLATFIESRTVAALVVDDDVLAAGT